jgi:hypothetical protein
MDGTKASCAAGFSYQQRLKKVLQRFSEERNDFMNGTLLGKLEPLMQLFQKHKPVFEECLLKMQQKGRLASLAVRFSRGVTVCFGIASLICTLLEVTLVMAPIGMLNIGFDVGVSCGQVMLQLAKEYRKHLKSESALVHRSMHGTTTAIHELADLQDKIQDINVRIPLHSQLLRVIKINYFQPYHSSQCLHPKLRSPIILTLCCPYSGLHPELLKVVLALFLTLIFSNFWP